MADNFVTNAGSGGDTFAADDIAGVKHPRTKIEWGADGTVNETDDASGKRVPVKIGEPLVDRIATGNLTAGAQTVEISSQGCGSVALQITGTFVATVQFEGTVDGTNWFSVDALAIAVGTVANSATAVGQWFIQASGLLKVRARCSAYTSGTVVVSLEGGAAGSLVFAMKGGTWTVDTELPAAAALADATSNPTVPTAGAAGLLYNGTTWDRVRGDITNGVDVDVTRLPSGTAAAAATAADNSTNSSNKAPVLPARANTSTPSWTDGLQVPLSVTTAGNLRTVINNASAITVDGSAVTQPVSAASLPLPTGAATLAEQQAQTTALQLIDNVVHTEDEASADGHSGVLMLARRTATPANTSGTDLDYEVPQMSAGRLWTSATIDAALPAGTNAIGKLAANSGVDIGDVDVTSLPALPAGTNNIGDVDVLTLPNVTLAAGTNTNEVVGDAAHDAAAAGNPLLQGGYASAAAPSDVSADADVVRAWHLRNGAAATVITAAGALVGGDATNGLDVDVTRVSGTVTVGGVAAHDAAVSGSPARVAGRARTSDYTAVANDDTADMLTDTVGKQVTLPYSIPENMTSGVTSAITGTSATSVIATPGASIRLYITQVLVTNSHATVGTVVELLDNTTVIYRGYAAPAGGGFALTFPTPLRCTANVAFQAQNVTTGSNTYVSASGYKAP